MPDKAVTRSVTPESVQVFRRYGLGFSKYNSFKTGRQKKDSITITKLEELHRRNKHWPSLWIKWSSCSIKDTNRI